MTSFQWVITIICGTWLFLATVFNTRWVKQDRQKIKDLEVIIKSRDAALTGIYARLSGSVLEVDRKICAIIDRELKL